MITQATVSATEVAEELRPVVLRLSRELRQETERFGVTPRQATLLWLIRRNPGLSLRDLAELERISPPALSGHVDRLERAQLVERVRSTDDRRRVGLRLTPAGDRLLRRIRTGRTTWLAERLERLEPEELERVAAALPALRTLVEGPA
jgi:DNA-binding MarR family transcriptional regulator